MINMVAFATRLCMGERTMKCQYCREEFDELYFRGRWCSRDCYLGDLDRHLEAKWEADMEGRLMEDDPKEDR